MRVLFLSETFDPDSGGIGTSARRIASWIARRGVEIRILTFRPGSELDGICQLERVETTDGTEFRIVPHFVNAPVSCSAKRKATIRRNAFYMASLVTQEVQPDLIHSFSLTEAAYLGTLLARRFDLPHIVSVRGNDLGRGSFQGDRFEILRWIIGNCDMATFVNQYLLSVAADLFPDACWKYRVVANSIDVRPYPAVAVGRRQALLDGVGVRSSSFLVSFTGNLREKKGPWTLLEAFAALRKEIDASLLIVGRADGDGLGDFSKMVLGFPSGRDVHVLGTLLRELVCDYQEISDVAIFPSLDDGMANGLLESMERARPVVVSDVFSDVVRDQVDGFVCRRFEVLEFSAALCALARDRELRIRVGKMARQRVAEAFSPQYESLEYVRAYQTTVRPSLRSRSYRGR